MGKLNEKKGHGEANKTTDECYTPDYAVLPLLKHIDSSMTVWCPFDKNWSEYVKVLRGNGNRVICSHIDDGADFFEYEPDDGEDY